MLKKLKLHDKSSQKVIIVKKSDTRSEIDRISLALRERLSEDQLFAPTKDEFCFHLLSYISLPNINLNLKDKASIIEGCNYVLNQLGYTQYDDISPLDGFMRNVAGFRTAPGEALIYLTALADSALKQAESYIKKYEEAEPFLSKGEKPRNHLQRSRKAFYDRCIEEKSRIREFLTGGIKDRAKDKAVGIADSGSILSFFETQLDQPYRMHYPDASQFFDFDKIDRVRHRVWDLSLLEARELSAKYKTDKKLFYEELEVKIPISQTLQSLITHVDYVMLLHPKRKEVFSQLKQLFEEGKWHAFYALGLTQIEGIFGEMCKISDSKFYDPKASIADKVNFIRPFYQFSDTGLDYFAFLLTDQRNYYLHNGLVRDDEDIELLCKDLLYDLLHVLRIFIDLNTDANELRRLVIYPDVSQFYSIKNFCIYFDLVKSVKANKQYSFFQKTIEHLNQSVFPELVFNVIFDIESKFQRLWKNLQQQILSYTGESSFQMDLNSISQSEISKKLPLILDELSGLFDLLNDDIDELLFMRQFIISYSDILDDRYFDQDTIDILVNFKSEHLAELNKVSQIVHGLNYNPKPISV